MLIHLIQLVSCCGMLATKLSFKIVLKCWPSFVTEVWLALREILNLKAGRYVKKGKESWVVKPVEKWETDSAIQILTLATSMLRAYCKAHLWLLESRLHWWGGLCSIQVFPWKTQVMLRWGVEECGAGIGDEAWGEDGINRDLLCSLIPLLVLHWASQICASYIVGVDPKPVSEKQSIGPKRRWGTGPTEVAQARLPRCARITISFQKTTETKIGDFNSGKVIQD